MAILGRGWDLVNDYMKERKQPLEGVWNSPTLQIQQLLDSSTERTVSPEQ